jgi:hypothetical protein
MSPPFLASFAFYALFTGVLSSIFLICSLRTNIVFVFIFIGATLGFYLAAGAFWTLAQGKVVLGGRLLQGTGGSFFVAAMAGRYLLAAVIFAELICRRRLGSRWWI